MQFFHIVFCFLMLDSRDPAADHYEGHWGQSHLGTGEVKSSILGGLKKKLRYFVCWLAV